MNYDDFILELRHAGLRPKVLIEDVQRLIDIQMASYKRLKFESKFSEFAYSKYHTLDEVSRLHLFIYLMIGFVMECAVFLFCVISL